MYLEEGSWGSNEQLVSWGWPGGYTFRDCGSHFVMKDKIEICLAEAGRLYILDITMSFIIG